LRAWATPAASTSTSATSESIIFFMSYLAARIPRGSRRGLERQ
jgi:hypothetical protein